jgi:hypothetical protein
VSQQEAARCALAIVYRIQGQKEPWYALNFIQDSPLW